MNRHFCLRKEYCMHKLTFEIFILFMKLLVKCTTARCLRTAYEKIVVRKLIYFRMQNKALSKSRRLMKPTSGVPNGNYFWKKLFAVKIVLFVKSTRCSSGRQKTEDPGDKSVYHVTGIKSRDSGSQDALIFPSLLLAIMNVKPPTH